LLAESFTNATAGAQCSTLYRLGTVDWPFRPPALRVVHNLPLCMTPEAGDACVGNPAASGEFARRGGAGRVEAGMAGIDIAALPRGLGLAQYEPAFRDNDIDGEVLPRLTAEDLVGLGVASIGHRRKLLEALGSKPD
jgi:hypothetical protein